MQMLHTKGRYKNTHNFEGKWQTDRRTDRQTHLMTASRNRCQWSEQISNNKYAHLGKSNQMAIGQTIASNNNNNRCNLNKTINNK